MSYLPPEGILALENKDLGYVGMPADCWSAGVLLYIMISYDLFILLFLTSCLTLKLAGTILSTTGETARNPRNLWLRLWC